MVEQLSLFDIGPNKDRFAEAVLKELNAMPTVWKDTFFIDSCSLEKWEHINDPEKVLSVYYRSTLNEMTDDDYYFTYWGKYEEDQKTLLQMYDYCPTLKALENDKDTSVSITPWSIIIYIHKFERKAICSNC